MAKAINFLNRYFNDAFVIVISHSKNKIIRDIIYCDIRTFLSFLPHQSLSRLDCIVEGVL